MLRVVLAALLGLGLWTVSSNRVRADDEKGKEAHRPRIVEAEAEKVEIGSERVDRDADRPRERRERETREREDRKRDRDRDAGERPTRERTLRQREEAIKKLRVFLDQLKDQQRKLEETDDAEVRERIAAQIRSAAAKLKDLQAVSRKERAEREERRGEREEHPEIRSARNRLEHMRAAIKHLKEARLTEYAQAVGQRAEKLQGAIHRFLDHGRERGEWRRDLDVVREGERRRRDRDREEVRRGGERERSARRKRAGNRERELNQAILQIRRELAELRNEVRRLLGERGERREGPEERKERDDG